MIYRIYGLGVFPNTRRRTEARTVFESQAATRGLTPNTMEATNDLNQPIIYGPACVDTVHAGKPGFTFCYSTSDEAVAQQAERDLNALNMDEPSHYGISASSE